ncbi:PDZ domain-containing protein, partial [bacterium]|nr:PDZ domain-containing protein [bacterium]
MKKLFIASVLLSLLLSVLVINAGMFDRLFSTKKDVTISQAEVTSFTAHIVKKRYLNKSKIKPEDLLRASLDALEDRYPAIIFNWNGRKGKRETINLQIYNKHYAVAVIRLRDIYDVVVVLRQIYGYIEKNYTPPEGSEMLDIEYTAVNGLLEKLDPHSYAFTPKEFDDFTSDTEGNFGGLGIVISMNDDGEIVVVSPIDGTPAMRAGIEAGDAIMQINDESAINMTLAQAVERMRGKPHTKITVRMRREGEPDLLTFHLVRAIIKIQSVIGAMPAKGIGYVKLTGFNENTYSQLLDKIEGFKRKKMKGLILDLRNNPGGLLSQSIKISDLFLKKGVIVSTVSDDEHEVTEAESERSDILNIPIIVMVNEGSASASEIVTAALQSNNRATVIGRKTFGKGSVQNLFRMPGGGGLKITIAQYLTPGDISIQSVGIVPEIELAAAFIDPKRVSVFKTNGDPLLEKDLDEHIVSKYSPKKPQTPALTIRYYKPYKDREQLVKERRDRPVGRFASDEEIEVAVKLLQNSVKKRKSVMAVAATVRDIEWDSIVKQLNKKEIKWHKLVSAKNINPKKIKITLVKGSPLMAGKENKLLFRAEYPGKVENLIAVLDTEIAYLGNLEVLFGSFKNSVEREVIVTLPDSMSWQDAEVTLNLGTNDITPTLTKQDIRMVILPKKAPKVSFNYRIVEKSGNINGVLEHNESVEITVDVTNNGKGAITKGRLLLINTNNNKSVFIESGSEAVALKPGEKTTKTFT